MNANLTQALALQAAAQTAQNAAVTLSDFQNVVEQWVAVGAAASNAGNDAAAETDAGTALTIAPDLQQIATANHQLGIYSISALEAGVTLQQVTELAAESGTEAGYAIQGATAALNALPTDTAGGVGPGVITPVVTPVVAPAASSSNTGLVVGLGALVFGGLTWWALK